jgi:hypothetical protein
VCPGVDDLATPREKRQQRLGDHGNGVHILVLEDLAVKMKDLAHMG